MGLGGSEETVDPVRRSLMVYEKLESVQGITPALASFYAFPHEHKGVREGWFSREISGLGFSSGLRNSPKKTQSRLFGWLRGYEIDLPPFLGTDEQE